MGVRCNGFMVDEWDDKVDESGGRYAGLSSLERSKAYSVDGGDERKNR